jgi:hypothetical protein
VKVVSFPQNPYLAVAKYKDKKPIKYAGYLKELWSELELRTNFT